MANNDLVSRKGLLSTLQLFNPEQNGYPLNGGIRHARAIIEAAPAAEVVNGYWIDYGIGVCCSNCGISLFHQDENNNAGIEPSKFAYCPHCGAEMLGGASNA